MPAGGHFPLARSRGRQPQPPSVSVQLPVPVVLSVGSWARGLSHSALFSGFAEW